MPVKEPSLRLPQSGDSLGGYAEWEAAVSSEQRFLRRTRRILTLLMVAFLVCFIGARVTGRSGEYQAVFRSAFGIGAATAFLLGAGWVIFRVHRTPRISSIVVMSAAVLLFGSEVT